jgi:hypothetical protein
MTELGATQEHTQTETVDIRDRIEDALIWSDFDCGGVADKVCAIVEAAVRARLGLSVAEFDLAFADMARAIEDVLAERLGDALDRDSVVAAIVEEFSEIS